MAFARFMAGPAGRLVRVVAGLALVAWGWTMASPAGWAIVAAGIVVFAAGAINLCLFAPLFGAPIKGSDLR